MKTKNIISLLVALIMCLSLAACGSKSEAPVSEAVPTPAGSPIEAAPTPDAQPTEAPGSSEAEGSGTLIVYFSQTGNTQKVAELIAGNVEADIFRIEPETPYTDDYNELLDVAQSEKSANARPAIAGELANLAAYDTVFLGWPCWWGTCPMIMLSFLEQYDLSGKTIVPFTTSGGSGFGTSLSDMQAVCTDALWMDGLSVGDGSVDNAGDTVANWLIELGI